MQSMQDITSLYTKHATGAPYENQLEIVKDVMVDLMKYFVGIS